MTALAAPQIAPRVLSVLRKGQLVTFSSTLTDAQAYEKCRTLTGNFARDLSAKPLPRLTPTQIAWLHKLAIEAERPAPAPMPVNLAGILQLFARVGSRLKWPTITLNSLVGEVQLSRCGERSRTPGAIRVTNGQRGASQQYYGVVTLDGLFKPSHLADGNVRALLTELSADPVRIAAEYGKLTGRCCFCRRPLDDARSTEVGYGPVCADHYGLPWGTHAPLAPNSPVLAAAQ